MCFLPLPLGVAPQSLFQLFCYYICYQCVSNYSVPVCYQCVFNYSVPMCYQCVFNYSVTICYQCVFNYSVTMCYQCVLMPLASLPFLSNQNDSLRPETVSMYYKSQYWSLIVPYYQWVCTTCHSRLPVCTLLQGKRVSPLFYVNCFYPYCQTKLQ